MQQIFIPYWKICRMREESLLHSDHLHGCICVTKQLACCFLLLFHKNVAPRTMVEIYSVQRRKRKLSDLVFIQDLHFNKLKLLLSMYVMFKCVSHQNDIFNGTEMQEVMVFYAKYCNNRIREDLIKYSLILCGASLQHVAPITHSIGEQEVYSKLTIGNERKFALHTQDFVENCYAQQSGFDDAHLVLVVFEHCLPDCYDCMYVCTM